MRGINFLHNTSNAVLYIKHYNTYDEAGKLFLQWFK